MKVSKGTVVVASAIGVLAASFAVKRLLQNEEFRRRVGLGRNGSEIDEASDESFPASDAPSWTSTTAVGSRH